MESRELADRFIRALHALEDARDASPITELFHPQCVLSNLALERKGRRLEGRDGARKFWSDYRAAFRDVRSRFERAVVTNDCIVLEWRSRGHLHSDEPIDYAGVSVLELRDGRVSGFRSYYDSAPFHAGLAGRRAEDSMLERQTSDAPAPGRSSNRSQAA